MTSVGTTVLYEEGMDLDFMDEIQEIPGGDKIKECIQCGTCSGACPVSWAMEETPRQLFAKIRAGMREEVLNSATIWTCASCYECTVHCPQQIKITDIMYALKRMAMREGNGKGHKGRALSDGFMRTVERYGRNHEVALMARFLLATRPFGMFRETGIGLKLLLRGRLPVRTKRIRGLDGLRKIVAKGRLLGGD